MTVLNSASTNPTDVPPTYQIDGKVFKFDHYINAQGTKISWEKLSDLEKKICQQFAEALEQQQKSSSSGYPVFVQSIGPAQADQATMKTEEFVKSKVVDPNSKSAEEVAAKVILSDEEVEINLVKLFTSSVEPLTLEKAVELSNKITGILETKSDGYLLHPFMSALSKCFKLNTYSNFESAILAAKTTLTRKLISAIRDTIDKNVLIAIPASQIFQNFEKEVDFLEKINKVTFSRFFAELIFENPTYAITLLKKYPISSMRFDNDIFCKQFEAASLNLTSAKEKDFAECMSMLMEKSNVNGIKIISRNLWVLIQNNFPVACEAIGVAITDNNERWDIIHQALKWDNVECYTVFMKLWKKELIASKTINEEMIMQDAIGYCSPKCMSWLLAEQANKKNASEIRSDVLEKGVYAGYLEIALVACNNNFVEVAGFIQSKITGATDVNLPVVFQRCLRYSDIDAVDKAAKALIDQQKNEDERKLLEEIYTKTRAETLGKMPFIARYKGHLDFDIDNNYNLTRDKTRPAFFKDFEYASSCLKQVESLLTYLKTTSDLKPINKPFSDLPPSSKGTRRVAALIEKIAGERAAKQKERMGSVSAIPLFGKLRIDNRLWGTSTTGRYQYARSLISAVHNYSKAPDFENSQNRYFLKYKNIVVNVVLYDGPDACPRCQHGMAPIKDTWPFIEDVFEEILAMKLTKKPGSDALPEMINAYEDQMTAFYSKAVELVWLIGNTQPFERGSGTIAEWLFGLIHLYHDIVAPTLTTQFPQLDMNNIVFPLSDYIRDFLAFRDQKTVPEHFRRKDLVGKPAREQLEILYGVKPSAIQK